VRGVHAGAEEKHRVRRPVCSRQLVIFLRDLKVGYIRLAAEAFGGTPVTRELRMSVEDSRTPPVPCSMPCATHKPPSMGGVARLYTTLGTKAVCFRARCSGSQATNWKVSSNNRIYPQMTFRPGPKSCSQRSASHDETTEHAKRAGARSGRALRSSPDGYDVPSGTEQPTFPTRALHECRNAAASNRTAGTGVSVAWHGARCLLSQPTASLVVPPLMLATTSTRSRTMILRQIRAAPSSWVAAQGGE